MINEYSSQLLQEHHRFLTAIKTSSCTSPADIRGEEFTERLCPAEPLLQEATQPQIPNCRSPAQVSSSAARRDLPTKDLVPTSGFSH